MVVSDPQPSSMKFNYRITVPGVSITCSPCSCRGESWRRSMLSGGQMLQHCILEWALGHQFPFSGGCRLTKSLWIVLRVYAFETIKADPSAYSVWARTAEIRLSST